MSSLANEPGLAVHIDRHTPATGCKPPRAGGHSRRRRTRGAFWKLAALLLALMLVAASLGGCASTGPAQEVVATSSTDRDADRSSDRGVAEPQITPRDPALAPKEVAFSGPDQASHAADSSSDVAPETRLLAAQNQRDVDLLLGNRPDPARTADAAPPTSVGNAAAASSPSAKPREIQWNDIAPQESPADLAHAGPAIAATPPPAASQPAANVIESPGLQPDRLRQLTVDLARELYATGSYSEHPLRELTLIAAMSMLEPERRLDPAAIPDLTDDEREVLASLQTFFGEIGSTLDGGTAVTDGVAQAAATLRQSLTHEPRLALPTAMLCTRVGGFGDYTAFERLMFLAGGEQKVIVYLEVKDFVSDINQDNAYVTELSQQLTIYSDRDGIPVWKEDWQAATDVSRNKRQDFFTVQVITLPKALGVGKYTLKARMRDEKSKAEAETSIPLELVADRKMISG
jgi:hypothetical protein